MKNLQSMDENELDLDPKHLGEEWFQFYSLMSSYKISKKSLDN